MSAYDDDDDDDDHHEQDTSSTSNISSSGKNDNNIEYICEETDMHHKKLKQFHKQVTDILYEVQAYLQTTVADEFSTLLSPFACPLQTINDVQPHHTPALNNVQITLTRRLANIANRIEIQMSLSNLRDRNALSGIHMTSIPIKRKKNKDVEKDEQDEPDDDDDEPDDDDEQDDDDDDDDDEVVVTIKDVDKSKDNNNNNIPTLDKLRKIALQTCREVAFRERVKNIISGLEGNIHKYEKCWKRREEMHRVINNDFLSGMRNICGFILDAFTKQLCPELVQLINAQKKLENDVLHAEYGKAYGQMKDERKQFYNKVESWAATQAHACIRMLDVLANIIAQCGQRRLLNMDILSAEDPTTLFKAHSTSAYPIPNPSYPLSYSPMSILEIDSQEFHGLRPNHAMSYPGILEQHKFLQEAMIQWQSSLKSMLSNDASATILPDMFQRLATWMYLYQTLFHDVILYMNSQQQQQPHQQHQQQHMTIDNNNNNNLSLLPEEEAELSSSTRMPRESILSKRRNKVGALLDTNNNNNAATNDSFVSSSSSSSSSIISEGGGVNDDNNTISLANVYEFMKKRHSTDAQKYDLVDAQFKETEKRYLAIHNELTQLINQREELDVVLSQKHDDDDDDDNKKMKKDMTETSSSSNNNDIMLMEMYSLQQKINGLRDDYEQVKTKRAQLRPVREKLGLEIKIHEHIVEFVETFETQVTSQWTEFCGMEAKQVSKWTPVRNSYHSEYLCSRKELWAAIDTKIFDTTSHMRLEICRLFGEIGQRHSEALFQLKTYFESTSSMISKTNDSIAGWHSNITLKKPAFSNEFMNFSRRLEEVVIERDKLAAQDYIVMMKQILQMFWATLEDMTSRLTRHPALLQFLQRIDKCCCEEHKAGIAHPFREQLSKLPCIVLKGSTLDKAMYQMHCASKQAQDKIRPSIISQRKQAVQTWTKLNQVFEQAEQNAYNKSVALDANIYIRHTDEESTNLSLNPEQLSPNVRFEK